jgi:hypothetical protein
MTVSVRCRRTRNKRNEISMMTAQSGVKAGCYRLGCDSRVVRLICWESKISLAEIRVHKIGGDCCEAEHEIFS